MINWFCAFLGSTVMTLALVACGGQDTADQDAAKPPSDPSAKVEAALVEHFEGRDYTLAMSGPVLEFASLGLELGEDWSPSEFDRVLEDNEHLRHGTSCVREGGNAYLCKHAIRGRYYRQSTTVDAVFDSATEDLVVREERTPSGESFP